MYGGKERRRRKRKEIQLLLKNRGFPTLEHTTNTVNTEKLSFLSIPHPSTLEQGTFSPLLAHLF